MKWFQVILLAGACGVLALGDAGEATQGKKKKVTPLAGWFGVFPELAGYERTFTAPTVTAGAKPTAYRQTARYEWLGGALKRLEVTLARDPKLAQTYANPPAGDKPAPRKILLGTRTGWLWEFEETGGFERVTRRLAAVLGDDKVLLLEARGAGPWEDLAGLLKHFNIKAIEAALNAPPRTDFGRGLEPFRQIKKNQAYAEVIAWVGHPDEDTGSGIHVLVWKLPDGSKVLLGTPDYQRVQYVKHQRADGSVEEIAK